MHQPSFLSKRLVFLPLSLPPFARPYEELTSFPLTSPMDTHVTGKPWTKFVVPSMGSADGSHARATENECFDGGKFFVRPRTAVCSRLSRLPRAPGVSWLVVDPFQAVLRRPAATRQIFQGSGDLYGSLEEQ